MIPDLDIYRAAELLIDQLARTRRFAQQRERMNCWRQATLSALKIWRAIIDAIEELQRRRHNGEPLN